MARSGSKTNTAKGNASKKASLRANEQREEVYAEAEPLAGDGANRDIAGVILAIVAIASFIAVVTPATAPVTQAVAAFYHLGFGLGAYVLPLAFLAHLLLSFARSCGCSREDVRRSCLDLRLCHLHAFPSCAAYLTFHGRHV